MTKKEKTTDHKESEKLLNGYTKNDNRNGKETFVPYTSLMTLAANPLAKHELTKDLEDAYHLSFNEDAEKKSYLYDYKKNRYVEVNERTLQSFLSRNEGIRLDTIDTSNILKANVKRIEISYDYIEFNNKLLNIKTHKTLSKTIKKTIEGEEYDTCKPRAFIIPKRIGYDLILGRDEDWDPDNSIIYRTKKQILDTAEKRKGFLQSLGLSIFNTGKEITIYYAPSGNNGKSILLYIRRLVLCELANLIRLDQFHDIFNHEIFNQIHELQIDEPEPYKFQKAEAAIKKATAGGMDETTRKMHSQDKQKTRLNTHLVIACNELPDFNLNDPALLNRISIIELKNKFSYLDHEINDINVFPINDNLQEELKKDIIGIRHLLYEAISAYLTMKHNGETLIHKKGIDHVRAMYLGNDHMINFLNLYTKLTDYETENTTATEILNEYKQYLKDNDINQIIKDEQAPADIGKKLNKLYGRKNIIRKMEDNNRYMKNVKCVYTTGVEKAYFVDPDLEAYEIVDKNHAKIFNFIKKGYNTFELLKQQEKDHNKIIESINYLKENEYIQENNKLKTNKK